jgi:hypothetical protein
MVQLNESAAATTESMVAILVPSRSSPRVVDSEPHAIGADAVRVYAKDLEVAVVLAVPKTMSTCAPSTTIAALLLIEPADPGFGRVRTALLPTASTIVPLFRPSDEAFT